MNFPCAMTHALNEYLDQLDKEEAYSEACWAEGAWIIQLTGESFIDRFGELEDDFIEGVIELMKTMTLREIFDLENEKANEARKKGETFRTAIANCLDEASAIAVEQKRNIDWY